MILFNGVTGLSLNEYSVGDLPILAGLLPENLHHEKLKNIYAFFICFTPICMLFSVGF